ncbi:MAG: mechanosensitive ion channel, partial [Pseudomonadota bacterium]|nr:mechanosensitive ion channel [Pseudomonadota bacterium]
LRIGEMLNLNTIEGRITDIRTRYTVIRSIGGREAIVPNEMLITSRVENSSLADPRVLLQTAVQVAYGTNVRALCAQLEAAVLKVARVIEDPAPAVHLAAFAADGIDLTINFWIRDSENGQGNVKSEVNLTVLDVLAAAKVEIPYPQRVIHSADVDCVRPPDPPRLADARSKVVAAPPP